MNNNSTIQQSIHRADKSFNNHHSTWVCQTTHGVFIDILKRNHWLLRAPWPTNSYCGDTHAFLSTYIRSQLALHSRHDHNLNQSLAYPNHRSLTHSSKTIKSYKSMIFQVKYLVIPHLWFELSPTDVANQPYFKPTQSDSYPPSLLECITQYTMIF